MLQHRNIDQIKRRGSWVAKLRQVAEYAVKTTPPDQFSSSKGSSFSERMQGRALSEILPNLFETAQLYEDHFARYNLYEGTGNQDPGRGTHVTWQPLTRPPRQPAAPRKRFRRARATSPPRVESDADASGNETEIDNTATESRLPQEKKAQGPRASRYKMQVPGRGPAASQAQHMGPHGSAATPNTSFGQPMHALHLGDNMDLDVKVTNHAPYHDQSGRQGNFHCSQTRQCCNSQSGYHHVLPPQQCLGPSNVVPVSTPGYDQPFSIFDAPYHTHAEGTAFGSGTGFPYDYDMFVPLFFDGLPNLPSISCQQEASRD
jgi:hypothetical protein